MKDRPIHIAHVVYSFATGGLENGVVNLINHLPENEYFHSIICVSDHDEKFYSRIKSKNVEIFDLNKKEGRGLNWLVDCWRLLRKIQPDICHTRNLSSIEAQFSAYFASVPTRIHGEHGWDVFDLGGVNKKYQLVRKCIKPFIHKYVGLSTESISYLTDKINVKPEKITHICNGVDIEKFSPKSELSIELPEGFTKKNQIVFGTVGRLAEVKNQTYLVRSFVDLWQKHPDLHSRLRLIVVGDGVLMPELISMVEKANANEGVWFTGLRADVVELMNVMDVFILPSLAEGIPNTVLEAMACGLPCIVTNVGGNPDLIMPEQSKTHIVDVNDVEQMVAAMEIYVDDTAKLQQDSQKVRQYCVDNFSIEVMVSKYHNLYQSSVVE